MSRVDNNYFTYRQTPATENGTGTLESIKGNTLVWNQLMPLSVGRTHNGITWTIGSDGLITVSGTATSSFSAVIITNYATIDPTHKYALISSGDESDSPRFAFSSFDSGNINESSAKFNNIAQFENTGGSVQIRFNGLSVGREYNETRYLRVHDLTQMFGAGNEPTSVDEFKALFPLPFYQFEQGKLLSFNGTGIKTVSKNQFNTQVITTSYVGLTLTKTQGTIRAVYSGGSQYAGFNFYGSPVFTDTFLKGRYRLSFDVSGLDTQWTVGLRRGASFLGGGQAVAFSNDGHYSFTIDAEANPNCYLSFARTGNKTTAYDVTFSNIQLELGTTETSYTPFEEKTISLPISQYFPTGMKSAKNAYDELTENKAVTRIGAVDLGTLNWYYTSGGQGRFASGGISSTAKHVTANTEVANIKNAKYSTISAGSVYNGNVGIAIDTSGAIWVYDTTYGTDASAFKTAMSGVYLCYELSTPLENYGVVDLGTLNWSVSNGVTPMRFQADMPSGYKKPTTSSERNRLICSKYSPNSSVTGSSNDTGITNYQNLNVIFVRDLSYSDVATFKNSLQGVYLLYEKENPTPIDLDITFNVYNGGTEQLLPVNDSTPTTSPILCDILYRGMIPVSVVVYPIGAGTVTGAGEYRYGETATLVATPNDIYRFLRYEDENGQTLSTDSTYSFEVGE